jgi:hypothetical protein
MFTALLAQAVPAPPSDVTTTVAIPWWQVLLANTLALTLLLIFVTAIITVLIQQRRKDKCLKLLHDYHVSYLTATGKCIWGDLLVFSKGLVVRFDAPYRNSRGIIKSSALIYETDMANCMALCRVDSALTDTERQTRRRQLARCVQPSVFRRWWRMIRNLFSTLKDAFSKAFSTVLGHVAKMKPGGSGALAANQASVDQIGQTLLGAAGNAYEPILEKFIGKPVILELNTPAPGSDAPDKSRPVELHGFLAEYSDKYVAIMNRDHTPIESIDLQATESLERPGMRIAMEDKAVAITCVGDDVLIVRSVEAGTEHYDLSVPLIHGSTLRLRRPVGSAVRLQLERTRRIDIVCPRSLATIHFGSEILEKQLRKHNWQGMAPSEHAEGDAGVTGSHTADG